MGLRIYTVHLPPSGAADRLAELVKEGFSWPAFFFGAIWALWHRLWLEAAVLLVLFIALGVLLEAVALGDAGDTAVMLALAVLIGAQGNDLRRAALRRRGFHEAGVVAGADPDSALRRFLDLRAVAESAGGTVPAASPAAAFGPPAAASSAIAGWYASDGPGSKPSGGMAGLKPGPGSGIAG